MDVAPNRYAPARLLVSHALGATAMSLPWPVLLARVFAGHHGDGWLGLTGAGRLLPYVVLSALAGMLADRVDRGTVLRWSAVTRAGLLSGAAAALGRDQLGAAVVLAVLAVAAGTPAYPAGVAVVPHLTTRRTERWTAWLVTAEVSAFVVGPALGGVLLGLGAGRWTLPAATGLAGLGLVPLLGLDCGHARPAPAGPRQRRLRTVLGAPGVTAAIAVVALVNLAEAAASVALVELSHRRWHAGDRGFGAATAALGLGALAAPLLGRLVGRRGALRLDGAGLAGAGVASVAAVAVVPLVLAGAASTAVECAATATLQRGVPDRYQAFSLGLTDSVMVAAAAVGAFLAPRLTTLVGPVPTFLVLGGVLVLAALRRPVTEQGLDVDEAGVPTPVSRRGRGG